MFVRLICPLCGQFLMKQRKDIKTEVKVVRFDGINTETEFAVKCCKCKNEVEIKKVS